MLVAYAYRKKGDSNAVNCTLGEVLRRMWTGLGGRKEGGGLLAAGPGKRFLMTPVVCLCCLHVCWCCKGRVC